MKKFTVPMLLLFLILSLGIVAADSNLPGAGWKSGQQIQNIDTADITLVLNAYDQSGVVASCGSSQLTPGQATNISTATDCAVPAGFAGSAVASADGQIAAVVNVNNKGVGAASGQYRGTDGASVATSLAFPLIKSNHSGRTTTLFVQNASDQVNSITAAFSVGGQTYTKSYANVPAYAMVVIIPSDAGVPQGGGNYGSLKVTGTNPIAGTSLEHETNPTTAQNLQASKAFTPDEYDSTVYCPLVRNAFKAKETTTGAQVQNVSSGPINITVEYKYSNGGGTTVTQNNIAAGASANFLQSNDIPANTLASATVTATGDIVAVVNDKATATNPQRVTTYACFPDNSVTSKVNLPLVKEDFGGSVVNTTGIQVQNVGNAATIVTLAYRASNGTNVTISHTDAIAAGASKTFYRVANGGTSNLTVSASALHKSLSGVVITADQPIVAIANESSLSGAIQDTKNYEGFNLAP